MINRYKSTYTYIYIYIHVCRYIHTCKWFRDVEMEVIYLMYLEIDGFFRVMMFMESCPKMGVPHKIDGLYIYIEELPTKTNDLGVPPF